MTEAVTSLAEATFHVETKQLRRNAFEWNFKNQQFLERVTLLPEEKVIHCIFNTSYVVYYTQAEEKSGGAQISEAELEVDSKTKDGVEEVGDPTRKSSSSQSSISTGSDTSNGRNATDLTKSLGRGIFRASTSVGYGLLKGATGLVSQTYEGAITGGIIGIAKGFGMGMIDFGSHTVKGAFRGFGQVTNTVGQVLLGSSPSFSMEGTIVLTNYRILWVSTDHIQQLECPVGAVLSIENSATEPKLLHVETKHLFQPYFYFESEELCYDFMDAFFLIFEREPYYFSDSVLKTDVFESDNVIDVDRDYSRLGFNDASQSTLKLLDNSDLKKFPTYPCRFAIPADLNDEEIEEIALYRSARRIPAVIWRHTTSGATICRCAQPLVGFSGYTSDADQKLVSLLKTGQTYHFVDARSQMAATANAAQGKGTEDIRNYPDSQLHHCDIANIHAVRSAFYYLSCACQAGKPHQGELWDQEVKASSWLIYVEQILCASIFCSNLILGGESLMVHCSDGWDRTPQITSLAQILLDPFYRSLDGFLYLIKKEWIDFGHMFRTRYSHGVAPHRQAIDDQSPIFVQWLDCLWQILRKFPWAFEFTEELLRFFYKNLYTCFFGTFLYNSIKEARLDPYFSKRDCVFRHILKSRKSFLNHDYDPGRNNQFSEQALDEIKMADEIVVWDAHIVFADPLGKCFR